jgi:hypothetical protein
MMIFGRTGAGNVAVAEHAGVPTVIEGTGEGTVAVALLAPDRTLSVGTTAFPTAVDRDTGAVTRISGTGAFELPIAIPAGVTIVALEVAVIVGAFELAVADAPA